VCALGVVAPYQREYGGVRILTPLSGGSPDTEESKAIEEAFAERVLSQLHKRDLITDDDVAQILSQDHTGFGVWLGDPFHDKERGSIFRRSKFSPI
jgi:hypothetical protein